MRRPPEQSGGRSDAGVASYGNGGGCVTEPRRERGKKDMFLGGAVDHAPPHLPDGKTKPRNSRECKLISETRGLTSLAE
jgi:hypothetical protein